MGFARAGTAAANDRGDSWLRYKFHLIGADPAEILEVL